MRSGWRRLSWSQRITLTLGVYWTLLGGLSLWGLSSKPDPSPWLAALYVTQTVGGPFYAAYVGNFIMNRRAYYKRIEEMRQIHKVNLSLSSKLIGFMENHITDAGARDLVRELAVINVPVLEEDPEEEKRV